MDASYWGIPTLDIGMQAESLVPPVTKWGTRARNLPMNGTWEFYTHDYKFFHLIRKPELVPLTGCAAAVEPNFTITGDTPLYEAIRLMGLKRSIARSWQEWGVRILVDLTLGAGTRFSWMELLGVPPGWGAYATRVYRETTIADLEADHALAVAHSGRPDPFFAVFGGGRKRIRPLCRGRGWAWVPERKQVVSGLVASYGC